MAAGIQLFNLKGKRALVTGSSQGIGYALAKGLYEAGFEVRRWRDAETNWPTVTPQVAMMWYRHFVAKHQKQENCIINTNFVLLIQYYILFNIIYYY